LRFDFKIKDPKDLFNKGLAYYLIGDFAQATMAFEESVIQGREFGYAYYGLAMIAVQTGQGEIAAIHLQKAISYNKSLLQLLVTDPIFEELMADPVYLKQFQIM
jgi:tetratricopeptide (TPR) repeat protein